MADPGAPGFSILEIRPDEYDALGGLTVRPSVTLRFEDPA